MLGAGQTQAKAPQPAQLSVGEVNYALTSERGAEEAWADLYRRILPSLYDSAARLIGPDDAPDAVHEAMLQIWRRRGELPPEARTASYVARAVQNHVVNRLRETGDEVELTQELEETLAIELPDEAGSFLTGMAQRLDAIVAAMPPRCREAYVLVHEQGLSGKEAAKEMGISMPTLKTHVARMNVILRQSLKRAALELDAGATERLLLAPPDALLPDSVPLLLPEVRHD
jgi:RNA polymerase sigma-70 factor (ECF subfamily)